MMMRVNTQRGYVMPGLGTIINTAAIVAGGLLGLLFKNLLTKSMEDTLLKASSVCDVVFIRVFNSADFDVYKIYVVASVG